MKRAVSAALLFLAVALGSLAAAQESSFIDKVQTCRRFDDSGPSEPTSTFGAADTVLCSFFLRGYKQGGEIVAQWKRPDGAIVRRSTYINGKQGDHYAGFGLKPPQNGTLVPGVYTVELLIDNRIQRVASFTVEAAGTAEARPAALGAVPPSPAALKLARAGRRFALLIGVGRYGSDEVNPLRYTVDDVEAVRRVLVDPRMGAVPAANVRVLTDRTLEKPTRQSIGKALNWLVASADRADDTVFVYYSGHGCNDRNGSYLLACDSQPSTLLYTGLNVAVFNKSIESVRAQRKIVILDACHSGGMSAAARGDGGRGDLYQQLNRQSTGEVRFLSCKDDESSYEESSFGHGVFTWFLVKAMEGGADLDGDGVVTVAEMVPWVQAQVQRFSAERGRHQTPVTEQSTSGIVIITDKRR